jgi:HAD superfamily hydrolase (TIGR01484 family)
VIKLALFDLDGTLAGHDNPFYSGAIETLRYIESQGVRIGLVSAKPADYLCGVVRATGLKDCIIVGESGAEVYSNFHFPVKERHIYPWSYNALSKLNDFKSRVKDTFSDSVFVQPNQVTYCIFPKSLAVADTIRNWIKVDFATDSRFKYFEYREPAFEIMPSDLDKSYAVKLLIKQYGLLATEVIAVGDGENDVPMFNQVGYSIGINRKEASIEVTSPQEAYLVLRNLLAGDALGLK